MKVLFLLHIVNRLRNFESLIKELAVRGHDVTVAVVEKGELALPETLRHPRIAIRLCEQSRGDPWQPFAKPMRRMRDALRYFHPRYERAHKLRGRAFEALQFLFGRWMVNCYGFKPLRVAARGLEPLLGWAEGVVPSNKRMKLLFHEEKPDVILVSPLVQRGAEYQVDYIKAAQDVRVPVAFLPFSWDNLSNKGLMRIVPDRVYVWNEIQKREAIEMHGVPEEKITVCGAWRFDDFAAMKPKSDRAEFARRVGLDPAAPIITYLCSSEFTSGNEAKFVREWIGALRGSADPELRRCGLLIRPYPDSLKWWKGELLSDVQNVAVMPQNLYGGQAQASWGDQELFDSLYHASAVVGLNTSAMIEAAILSKPVHTVLVEEFRGGQEDTIHFRYFLEVNGGLLNVAKSLAEHAGQLSKSLAVSGARDARSDGFVKAFVRPLGLQVAGTPVVVGEIEKLSKLSQETSPRPEDYRFARPLLLAVLGLLKFGFDKPEDHEPLGVRVKRRVKGAVKRALRIVGVEFRRA